MVPCVLLSGVSAQEPRNDAAGAAATVKRLLEAERQAQEILKEAEQRAKATVAEARAQAATLVASAREEAEQRVGLRLEQARATSAAKLRESVDHAAAEAQALDRLAKERLPRAVDLVVGWVTGRRD